MDASKLKDVLNRAKRITQMDVNGQLNEVANRARENGKMEYNDENIQYIQENQVWRKLSKPELEEKHLKQQKEITC